MSDNSGASGTAGLVRAGFLSAGAIIGAGITLRLINNKPVRRSASTTAAAPSAAERTSVAEKTYQIDGVGVVERITYALSDSTLIVLPNAKPSHRCLGDETALLAEAKKTNAFDKTVDVLSTHIPAGHASIIMDRLEKGELLSVLVASGASLVDLLPSMYQIADSGRPAVFHVVPGSVDFQCSFKLNFEEVLATRQVGAGFLVSGSVQEAQDMALIAHAAAARSNALFVHLLDSAYAGDQQSTLVSEGKLRMVSRDLRRVKVAAGEEAEEDTRPTYLRTSQVKTDHLPALVEEVMDELSSFLGKKYRAFEYVGPSDAEQVIVTMGSTAALNKLSGRVGILRVRLLRPWSEQLFLQALPTSVKRIAVIDQQIDDSDLGALFLDVVASTQACTSRPQVLSSRMGGSCFTDSMADLVANNLFSATPTQRLVLPNMGSATAPALDRALGQSFTAVPEANYTRLLERAIGDRIVISNASSSDSIWGNQDQDEAPGSGVDASSFGGVEFGYGALLATIQRRKAVINAMSQLVADDIVTPELRRLIEEWLVKREDAAACDKLAGDIERQLTELPDDENQALQTVLAGTKYLRKTSQWLVGGSNWAYDLSLSGIHHVIASKENINVMIVETECYSGKDRVEGGWKKDVGLYAMNYGGVYVASVAVYSSYTQVLRAMKEADAFPGPSIILAYAPVAPGASDVQSSALTMLKETKAAVDEGKWPLYRWNPALESPFELDSQYIQQQLEKFLVRENNLSMLVNEVPAINKALASSVNTDVKAAHTKLQQLSVDSYRSLLKDLKNSQPVLFIYGSDGGNAQGVAERLHAEATARGLDSKCVVMDDCGVEDLKTEPNVVAVVSTAGQGEFPMNARAFWSAMCTETGPGMLTDTKFAVFAMGDRHYWPRPEEKHYFAKAGFDLDKKFEEIGGQRLTAECGVGDDQDDDGYNTGLAKFEPELWEALGVAGVAGAPKVEQINDDQLKIESNYLRGTILEGLADESTGALAVTDTKLTKFHGIYQQDDRDLRESRRQQGVEKAYSFMIRVRVPGGVATPAQYLAMDQLGDTAGNGSLKLTTRQAFQLHGVIKKQLKQTIADINATLMDTLAACGDVCRNVMCNPMPFGDISIYDQVQQFARDLSAHLSPRTSAYHEIWLDKKPVAGYQDVEPLYGPTYLPRKFKVSIAVPPNNDVDCYAHCLNYVAIIEDGKLAGFNVLVGGGMGMTHNNKKTYPRTADVLGFCTLDQACKVGESVMLTQRDFGERLNRKHARLKYTLEDMGVERFREEVEKRAGFKMQAPRPFAFDNNNDRYGWHQSSDGMWHYGMFIENGRIKDTPDYPLKTALREIAKVHKGDFRLTGNANMYIGNVDKKDKAKIQAMMDHYKIGSNCHTGLRLSAMACASLPLCALAFAESERYLPSLISKLENAVEAAGLRDDSITMRMTGCPNGCARPYLAEIGFVGRAPGTYNLYLGAGHAGQRLSKLYKEAVNEDQIIAYLSPLFGEYAKERNAGEYFGDFVIRKGYVKATTNGADFHENLGDVF